MRSALLYALGGWGEQPWSLSLYRLRFGCRLHHRLAGRPWTIHLIFLIFTTFLKIRMMFILFCIDLIHSTNFIEYLVHASDCSRCWECWEEVKSLPLRSYILVGGMGRRMDSKLMDMPYGDHRYGKQIEQ